MAPGDYSFEIVGGPGKWDWIVGFADHNLLEFSLRGGANCLGVGAINAYVESMSRISDDGLDTSRYKITGTVQTAGAGLGHQSAHLLGEGVTYTGWYDYATNRGKMTITIPKP